MPGSVTGDWGLEFPTWRERLDERFKTIREVPLAILVWGPGEHSPSYAKRVAICEHLRTGNAFNEVVTSEFLVRQEVRFSSVHVYEAEEIQLDAADVAIVLVADPRATGSRMEAGMFGLFQEFREKLYLVLPAGTFGQGRPHSFIDLGLERIPPERRFEYTAPELEDCKRIRSFCFEAVERARADRGIRLLRHLRG